MISSPRLALTFPTLHVSKQNHMCLPEHTLLFNSFDTCSTCIY